MENNVLDFINEMLNQENFVPNREHFDKVYAFLKNMGVRDPQKLLENSLVNQSKFTGTSLKDVYKEGLFTVINNPRVTEGYDLLLGRERVNKTLKSLARLMESDIDPQLTQTERTLIEAIQQAHGENIAEGKYQTPIDRPERSFTDFIAAGEKLVNRESHKPASTTGSKGPRI